MATRVRIPLGTPNHSCLYLTGVHPCGTSIIIDGFAQPEILVEVDVVAVIPDRAPRCCGMVAPTLLVTDDGHCESGVRKVMK